MKNLKKVLALVLVMAVVFGFAAMTSSAAFTDDAEIARKEAVDVMKAIGVINGYTDGTFKPKGEVTRAEMAKMITVLLNKGDDVGDLYKGAVTFADSASHWAAGYIAYCAQEKIINGRNASTFDPNANVTGTEAAKMLLCALGYDPETEGLTGANWAANTLSLAKKCEQKAKTAGYAEADIKFNLLDDMDSVPMTAPLSRENAAQMMLNAMFCSKVSYKGSTQAITINGVTLTNNAELQCVGENLYQDYNALLAGKKLTKKDNAQFDPFGRPAKVWTRGSEDIGTYSNAPDLIYTDAVTGGKFYTDLGKLPLVAKVIKGTGEGAAAVYAAAINALKENGDYQLVVYVDGKEIAEGATGEYADYAPNILRNLIKSGETKNVLQRGSWSEVYIDDDTARVTVIIARYYIGTISTVTAAQKDANGDVLKEAYVTVKSDDTNPVPNAQLKFADGSNVTTTSGVFFTEDFTAADRNVTHVVYTKGTDADGFFAIQTLAKAEVKAGLAGSTSVDLSTNKVTSIAVDSATYYFAESAKGIATDTTYGSEATIYLDPNGNALYLESTTSNNYAYVMGTSQETSTLTGEATQAKLLFTDGTCKIVDVNNENGTKYKTVPLNTLEKTIVTYTVLSNGQYNLTTIGQSNMDGAETASKYGYINNIKMVATSSPSLYRGTNKVGNTITGTDPSKIFANDSTVFIVETSAKEGSAITYSYTTYTGMKAVPTIKTKSNDAAELVIAAVNSKQAESSAAFVFVVGGEVEGAITAKVSVFMKNAATDTLATDSNNTKYYTTQAVVDGEIKRVSVTDDVYTNTETNYLVTNTLTAYTSMKTDASGYISSLSKDIRIADYVLPYKGFHRDADGTDDGLYNNGIIQLVDTSNATKPYSVSANVPVFVFDLSANTVTQTTIDAFSTTMDYNEALVVLDSSEKLLNGNDIVSAIYVSLVAKPAT